jgi:hypothetical protein
MRGQNNGGRCPLRWHLGPSLAASLMLVSAADAQLLRCRGDLVFADSMARRVTLLVDSDEGFVKNLACHKYPELRGFCAGVIMRAKDGDFVFGRTISEENAKLRIELIRTNPANGTDSVLNRWPRATFLGRCEPTRIFVKHRRT